MRLDPDSEHYRWNARPEDAWRLLTEPMTQHEAQTAADAITRALPHVHAHSVDPREDLVVSWDRRTVELMRDGLVALADSGREVPEHLLPNLDSWLALADPLEDPAVPLVEELLAAAAERHPVEQSEAPAPFAARHALWICPCYTMKDAPTWVIYDDPDGSGLAWCRLPEGPTDISDIVTAQAIAGGHTDPGQVLAWLRGEAGWSGVELDGDVETIELFERRLRGSDDGRRPS